MKRIIDASELKAGDVYHSSVGYRRVLSVTQVTSRAAGFSVPATEITHTTTDGRTTATVRLVRGARVSVEAAPTISQRDFFALAAVKAAQEVQKSNPYGSEAHQNAYAAIVTEAKKYGAERFLGNYED